jgi:hypothetical protein
MVSDESPGERQEEINKSIYNTHHKNNLVTHLQSND